MPGATLEPDIARGERCPCGSVDINRRSRVSLECIECNAVAFVPPDGSAVRWISTAATDAARRASASVPHAVESGD